MIDKRVAIHRSSDAKQNANTGTDDDGDAGKLDGRGEDTHDFLNYRPAGRQGHAEIEPQYVPHIGKELNQ